MNTEHPPCLARTPCAACCIHNTTTAGSTEAREEWLEYDADERRWIVPAGRRRTAGGPVLRYALTARCQNASFQNGLLVPVFVTA